MVRTAENDSLNKNLQSLQVAQNKMLRLQDNSTLRDRKSTSELLQNLNMLSVNQLAASIKLTEAWKMCNIHDYPLKLEKTMIILPQLAERSDPVKTGNGMKMVTPSLPKRASPEILANYGIWLQPILKQQRHSIVKKLIRSYCKTLRI